MAAALERPMVPGIIGALRWETAVFESCSIDDGYLVETTGPGPAAAAAGAERAVERGVDCLVSWGTAGALAQGEPGEIVLPGRVLDGSGRAFETDVALTDHLIRAFESVARVHRGTLVSAAAPVLSVAAKRALANASGAVAVDMESAAIGQVASASGLPLVVVRVIVDRADRAVPAAAVAGMDGPATRPGRVLAGLLKSPLEIGGLIALGFAAGRARRTLRACAPILAGLGESRPT